MYAQDQFGAVEISRITQRKHNERLVGLFARRWYSKRKTFVSNLLWTKNQLSTFNIFVPIDLDFLALDHKFAVAVTLVQRCVSVKLEVFTIFFISIKSEARDERTDGRDATLNAGPMGEGHITTGNRLFHLLNNARLTDHWADKLLVLRVVVVLRVTESNSSNPDAVDTT